MPIHPRRSCLAGALLLSVFACTPSQPTGSVQFAASTQQALSASDVTRVKVTVSASDMSSLVVDMAQTNGSWGGLIGNIPAGTHRSFLAEAFDTSGTLRFQGSTSAVTITANQTTAVALTLQELALPPPYSNEAPIIDSLVASSTSVQAGGSLSLTATLHDPNAGDTLTLAWTTSGGTFSAPAAATTSWTAPASPGLQTFTFTVTDSQGAAVSVSLTVNVVSGASTGNAALNVSFNLWPVVSKVSASLNRLDAGQSTTVSALASDTDGDALSYQWTASCPGTWTNATSSAASFVPSSVPAGACNNCRLTVTVQDGRGGQTTGSLNLCVASSSTEHFLPTFTHFYQSAPSASPGQTVSFGVTAMDSQASSLTFTWTANTGSLAVAQNTASTSQVHWTAPACAVTGVPPTVTATVTNAFGLSATIPFSPPGLPTCTPGWATTGALAAARSGSTATLLPSGKVLITGGYNGGALATAELYDPGSGTWSTLSPMISPRGSHTATLLPNGKVLVAGGNNGDAIAAAEVYDPASNTWSATAPMLSRRDGPSATLLANGKVLVAGGWIRSPLASAEVYDPASGTWSAVGSMSSPHWAHKATLLPNGKVLVTGGSLSGNMNASDAAADVYDPATGTWSATASMTSPRIGHTATLLTNGKVLVTGGYGGTYFATAEVYDPAAGTWSATASMASPHVWHTATLLTNSKVLIAGGSTAEVYDPATGTWSAAGSLASARESHTATLLTNGKVLVSGGATHGSLAAELYTP
ncbi:Kelch repeat-containing protein [Hyalangium minutum]|uniref:High-affinity leucine-specific transport system, periplasmic binding protein LivK n=1 Tax=Hyalangium minutum TaxID=394096 RepID=A0A085WCA1_9BACT|nr:kelch motif-containing protein [Hyalangium minutum]KFE65314.1 High-affinity leucine-specific transport system, periplasmic binding protein LivK [Hyalangium minutum]